MANCRPRKHLAHVVGRGAGELLRQPGAGRINPRIDIQNCFLRWSGGCVSSLPTLRKWAWAITLHMSRK